MRKVYIPQNPLGHFLGLKLTSLATESERLNLGIPTEETIVRYFINNVEILSNGFTGTNDIDGQTLRIETDVTSYEYQIDATTINYAMISVLGVLSKTIIQKQLLHEVAGQTYEIFAPTLTSPVSKVSSYSFVEVLVGSNQGNAIDIDLFNNSQQEIDGSPSLSPPGSYFIYFICKHPFYPQSETPELHLIEDVVSIRNLYIVERDTREDISISKPANLTITNSNIDFASSVETAYSKDLSINTFNLITDGDNLVQNVYNIIFTNAGERFNNPEFGCSLKTKVFTVMDTPNMQNLQEEVFDAIEKYEVRVAIDRQRSSIAINHQQRAIGVELYLILPNGNRKVQFIVRS